MSRFQSGRIGQYKIQETRTVKRTLIATKINLAGWNVTLKEKTKKKLRTKGSFGAHQTSYLAKDIGEGVHKLYYRAKAIDELPIFVSILFEHFHILLK